MIDMRASDVEVDIAIVGGGLVGTALACALAPLGWNIMLIEATPLPARRDDVADGRGERFGDLPPDPRCFALAGASCRILEGLGAWPALAPHASPIRDIVVTERGRPGRVHLDPAELGLRAFGQVVPAPALGRALAARAESLPGVTILRPAQVTSIRQTDGHAELTVSGAGAPARLRASLVVAADGAESPLRDWLDVPVTLRDYGQVAIVFHVTPERAHNGRAFERMTETGPFAMLPLPGGRCGLVWCVEEAEALDIMSQSNDTLLRQASERSGGVLGRFSEAGERRMWPLSLVVPETDVAGRVVFMGNAAHTIHPAGAQGFNLGLRDVATLAEVLSGHPAGAMHPAGRDPTTPLDAGAPWRLAAYAKARRPDREATVAFTDGLVSLFSSPTGLARGLRSAGLLAHAMAPPLRRRLVSAAMGYRAPIPALALGQRLEPVREQAA